ncbi:MAG: hypothetical protein IT437_05495 [Phycisphaerales bacterium]|nr:hypothetical protein [Phycisphaerales bacterium]
MTGVLGFSFPFDDWQFWVVTAVALAAGAWLLRGLRPGRKRRRTRRRVSLTIGGRTPEK